MISFQLFLSFLITLFAFFSPLSKFAILFFVPFLILASSSLSLMKLLFLSFFSGLFVDLFRFDFLGEQGVLYLITSFILLRGKKFLFEERPLYLSFFSFIFTFLSELFRLFFLGFPFFVKNVFFTPFYFSLSTFFYAIMVFVPFVFGGTKLYELAKRTIFLKKR